MKLFTPDRQISDLLQLQTFSQLDNYINKSIFLNIKAEVAL